MKQKSKRANDNSLPESPLYQNDCWNDLRRFTQARIGLGRAGISLPTKHQLQFNIDHAAARDAVHIPLNCEAVEQELGRASLDYMRLHSKASHRSEYLQRPDLGRCLASSSVARLKQFTRQSPGYDVAIVLVDGLSSVAVQTQGSALCAELVSKLKGHGLSHSPICIVEQGRVAIGDEIGKLLQAKSVVLIVGERPGLSSPDSLGIYYTFSPKLGLTDANRNCISNIRPAGLNIVDAALKCSWLVMESRRLGLSGVALKDKSDESDIAALTEPSKSDNFLLS